MDNDHSEKVAARSSSDATGNDSHGHTTASNDSTTATPIEQQKHVPVQDNDRIAQRHGHSTVHAEPGAYTATNTIHKDSVNPELRGFEADIVAKQTASSFNSKVTYIEQQDINAKQKGRSNASVSAKPGAYSASNGVIQGLRNYEAEIIAKQTANSSNIASVEQDIIAKQNGRSTSVASAKPGAYTASTIINKDNVNPDLRNYEADIIAKQTANSSNYSVTSVEQDIIAKQKGRSTSVAATKPGAYSAIAIVDKDSVNPDLRNYEADIIAKQRANHSVVSETTVEQDIIAKQKGRSTTAVAAKPGAYTASTGGFNNSVNPNLRSYEADIIAKQTGNSFKQTAISVEQDIIAKQKGRSTAALPAIPGAYSGINVELNGSVNPDIRNYEADIIAKQHGYSSSTSSDKTSLHGCEADILAKQTARVVPLLSGTGNAFDEINQLERDIIAKRQVIATREQIVGRETDITAKKVVGGKMADMENRNLTTTPSLREMEEYVQTKLDVLASPSKRSNNALSPSTFSELQQSLPGSPNKISQLDGNGIKKDEQSPSNLQDLEYGEYGGNDTDGLAVAFAVDEDDGDMYLPSAVEFDPDAKPPIYRNRRFRLYAIVMLFAAIVGTIGAVLGITLTKEEIPPVIFPYRETLGIRENVERVISIELLNDITSPYRKALDWITYKDPMALTPESERFMQRYLLAYFYYATSVKKPWTDGCAPSETEKDKCLNEVVSEILPYRSHKDSALRWLSNTDECTWAGIDCDSSHQVRSIKLSGVGMTGTFPDGILILPFLQKLSIAFSELGGPLPDELGNLKMLHSVNLRHNLFTGTIPESWLDSRSLISITLEFNQLTGKLTNNVTKLEDVKDLTLTGNRLSGTIPVEFGEMINLGYLYLNENGFNGTFPSSLGKLSMLIGLDLSRNALTGTIPEDIGSFSILEEIYFHGNLLTGKIPEKFWNSLSLYYIKIGDNFLEGPISNKLTKLTNLRELNIQNNQFTGALPARIGQTDIWRIIASGNKFNGTVAPQICDLVEKKQLTELELDCAAPLGGTPEIICPAECCSLCCNSDGEDCVKP